MMDIRRALSINIFALIFLAVFFTGACTWEDKAEEDDDDAVPADDTISADDTADDADDDDTSDDDTSDDTADDTADDTTDDDDTYVPPSPVYGYYSETITSDDLQVFADNDLTLFLGMTAEDIGDANLENLLLEAKGLGVKVRAWGLLPYEEGYWPNEKNVDSFVALAYDLADWFIEKDLGVEWIVVDLEMNIEEITHIQELFTQGDILNAINELLSHFNPVGFAYASEAYNEMIDTLHGLGMRAMTVTYPQALDDLYDEDTTIQDLLDVPVSTVDWDEVSTMVYTTLFSDVLGMGFGPDLVYQYGKLTVERFGDRSSIALGVTGDMADPAEFSKEVAAAKAAGIERIQAYSYYGSAGQNDPQAWHDGFSAAASTPPAEPMSELLLMAMQLIDALL